MAAKRFRSPLVCVIVGHKWRSRDEIRGDNLPWRCEKCGHYDDEPKMVRGAARRAWFRRWSPLTIKLSRKELAVRAGLPYINRRVPNLSLRVELHYAWDRYTGGPGVLVSLHAWRLMSGVRIGGLWQDEDGDGRALVRVWADFTTYGLRYIGCWFGHRPGDPYGSGYVSCERCEETLEEPNVNRTEAKVAA